MADKVRRPIFVPSHPDPVLILTRVLHNLLISECKYCPSSQDYMRLIQSDLAPHHRKIVTDWMLEVCEEQNCSPQVFLTSVQYLDRVLSQLPLKTGQLQLLASACLLLASKLHDPNPLTIYKLVVYTDCSISLPELQSMEMMVLEKLRWELASPNSCQFLAIILPNIENIISNQVLLLVQKHASNFLTLAATEYKYYNVRPSLLACSSILAAIQHISPSISSTISSQNEIQNLLISLVQTTKVHLSLMTSSLQQSLSNMMADACNTEENSDSSVNMLVNIDNSKQIIDNGDTSSNILVNKEMLDKSFPDILKNITDTNSNTIKCGISRDVVTMDIS